MVAHWLVDIASLFLVLLEGKDVFCWFCHWGWRKVWLLLVPSLLLRKDMAADEATTGRVAQLVSGCCWCRPRFSRDGVASCWEFSREASLWFWCCFSVTVGGRAEEEKRKWSWRWFSLFFVKSTGPKSGGETGWPLVNEGLGYREVGAGEIDGWGREGLVKAKTGQW